jgi:superfamily II DNA/RNA helicase
MVIHDGGRKRRVITTLFIVPHRDLALQIMHWIERITTASKPSPALASIAQILIRGSSATPFDVAVGQLKTTPPHILVCTPQAFLEVYQGDQEALQLSTLSTVIVDEVDYLVETAARKEFGKAFIAAHEKKLRKLKAHPGPTREILDIVYAGRQKLARRLQECEERDESETGSVAEWRNQKEAEQGHPQLVLSSATLRVHLKDYLFGESGWLNPYNLAKIMGATASAKYKQKGRILHSVLVVSDSNKVQNVESAVAAPEEEIEAVTKADVAVEEEEEAEMEDDGNRYHHESRYHCLSGRGMITDMLMNRIWTHAVAI